MSDDERRVIDEVDTDSDSHWDEDGGFPTVISMAHHQLVGIGSDELTNLPWDPGVHLASSLLHLMMIRVALESSILHSWIILRGLAGICSMWRDRFSLLILMIELLRFGYLGKWSPCAYESLSTKGETFTLILYFMILISL
jgi:hypothetical protein